MNAAQSTTQNTGGKSALHDREYGSLATIGIAEKSSIIYNAKTKTKTKTAVNAKICLFGKYTWNKICLFGKYTWNKKTQKT